jgi:signal transduction histidine kinase
LVRTQISQKKLTISLETVPLEPIRGDEKKIRHVILNLLSNACKFSREGGMIGVIVEKEFPEVRVAVWDQGIGIETPLHEKVFEEFYQVSPTNAGSHSGTGIGLSICKKFVELHNGRIWVESVPGEGSRFTFSVPLVLLAPGPLVEATPMISNRQTKEVVF